ncbi:hypothetical protein ACJX0J_006483, partial [Zea mays]
VQVFVTHKYKDIIINHILFASNSSIIITLNVIPSFMYEAIIKEAILRMDLDVEADANAGKSSLVHLKATELSTVTFLFFVIFVFLWVQKNGTFAYRYACHIFNLCREIITRT